MAKIDRKELILNGNMYKAITIISLPLMVNNFIQTLYNLADAIWVSKLGSVQFAATSFVWPVIFLFISLGIGISVAGASILSQLIGASEHDEANKYASQLIILSLIFSLFFALIGYGLSPHIIKLMGGTGDLAIYSNIYLKICFLGFPFVFFFYNFDSIMTAQGNTLIPTILSAISTLMNVILDPIFIFHFGMGVAGAAIATVISQALLALAGLIVLRKYSPIIQLSLKGFKFKKTMIKKILEVGLPASVGQSGAALGFIVLNSFIASYGTATLAAFAMVNRITSLIMQPPMGIGAGLTSIVGQNMGANQMDRVEEAFKKAVKLTLALSLVGAVLILWKDMETINIFMSSERDVEVINQGLSYLRQVAITIPLMGLFSIFQGLFQGSGHTKYSMAMEVGRLWFIRIPMIQIFKYSTNLGPEGIWIAMSSSNFLICVYGYMVYRSNKWQRRIIKAGH
ncbi:MATE family efflux transporter [Tepidimicrobium xylanilyticum]|uniref:Probable multidrug resistance protein NorM n=1 Tax=Tepidimicrobium xylanilyticum TaxID=1123352 RepID=A0A1H2ZCT6_9FIRM|nr:MATE family efflux transporter [Tepidimicrobium xylanilyticum]SDX15313.1 putative efflux protein, MATE family [Tepidimicrobium xylanilyticum]